MILTYYEKTDIIINEDNIEYIEDVEKNRYTQNKIMIESMGLSYDVEYKFNFTIGDQYLLLKLFIFDSDIEKAKEIVSQKPNFHSWT